MATAEKKALSNYRPGVSGHDPDLEHVQKVAWDLWEEFHGAAPYFFAFSAVASETSYQVRMGVLERVSRKWVPLNSFDFMQCGERARFAHELIKALPVVKGIMSCGSSHNLIPHCVPVVRRHQFNMEKSIKSMKCAPLSFALAMLEWRWDVPRSAGIDARRRIASEIASKYKRMSAVFDRIENAGSQATFSVMERVTAPRLKLVFNLVGVTSKDGEAPVLNAAVHGMKGFFKPYGFHLHINSPDQLRTAVVRVAHAVQFLQSIGVVHNDIRWENIGAADVPQSGKPPRVLLFDFDDAAVMNDAGMVPGMDHLSQREHAPSVVDEHGGEVDVWAMGYLLHSHSHSEQTAVLIALGVDIMARYQTMQIAEVIERLASVEL